MVRFGRVDQVVEPRRMAAVCALPSIKRGRGKAETHEARSKREHWIFIPVGRGILARTILLFATRDNP